MTNDPFQVSITSSDQYIDCPNVKIDETLKNEVSAYFKSIFSEFIASFFYILIVCGSAVSIEADSMRNTADPTFGTSLASGLAVAVLTHCFMDISGAHINPAVTFACYCLRMISTLRMISYVLVQLFGSILAAAFICW